MCICQSLDFRFAISRLSQIQGGQVSSQTMLFTKCFPVTCSLISLLLLKRGSLLTNTLLRLRPCLQSLFQFLSPRSLPSLPWPKAPARTTRTCTSPSWHWSVCSLARPRQPRTSKILSRSLMARDLSDSSPSGHDGQRSASVLCQYARAWVAFSKTCPTMLRSRCHSIMFKSSSYAQAAVPMSSE